MDLVEFIEHLFEAFKERVAAQNDNCFLCPNRIIILVLRMLELTLQPAWALFIESQDSAVLTITFTLCQDKVMRLWRDVQSLELYARGEAEMCDIRHERLVPTVFRRVFVEYFRREASLEEVDFHKAEQPVLFQSEAIRDNLDPFLKLVGLKLLVAFTLDYIDIVDGLLKLLLPLNCHTECFVCG